MSGSRILRRFRRHPLVFAGALVLLASGLTVTGVTFASFTAETQNQASTLAGGWVGAATNLSDSLSGANVVLAWTPGAHGVTGQQLWAYDNGSSSTCPASGYSLVATMSSATTSSYTDSPPGSASGHYYCYRMVSTSSVSWTATAGFPALQLGLTMTSAVITNGHQSGQIDNGDYATITFSQQTALTSSGGGATTICMLSDSSGNVTLLFDDSTCSNASTDPYTVKMTGVTSTHTNVRQNINATRTVSSSAPWTVVWTLTSSGQSVNSGTWTIALSSALLSAGGAPACSSCTLTSPQPGF